MKKMLLTGATSLIGRNLIPLARDAWEITAVVRPGTAADRIPDGVRLLELDMADYARLGELAGPCDCLVHLAWNGTRGAQRMDVSRQTENLRCSLAGLRSMLQVGCKRVVTAGSQAEYGPHTEQISEETPCSPNTEYGKAKLAFYQKTAELCQTAGVEYREPRFFSLYGPGDYDGTMVISILRDMLANRPCRLTQGVQNWDFLYLDDATSALYRLCTCACPNGVYNFGSGDVRQLKDYVLEMARITETGSELQFGAIPYPPTGMVSLWPDISKLKRELDWTPAYSFEDGIISILRQMKGVPTA